jgi:diguanylate cyclase (GGDEF)-like protein
VWTGDALKSDKNTQMLRWSPFRYFQRLAAPYAIVISGVLIALFMVAICALSLYQGRLDALARATDASRNLALLAERDIERNFELYSLSLQAVVDGVGDPEVMSARPWLRNRILFDRAATASYLGAMLVFDAKGDIVLDSASDVPRKGNYSDREYFKIHRDNPNVGLYVSDPYRSRLRGGSPSIVLSRRISRPDGSFAGVVVVAVELEYFHKLFAALSLGAHGSVALIGRDGAMIMRQPYDPKVIGRNIRNASTFRHFVSEPEGSFSDTASIDGVRRLYYFRNLPNLPLIIMVAEAHSDIYAAWQRRALTIGSLMAVFAAGFVGLAFAFGAQLRRRMRAESELAMLARTDGLTGLNNRRTLGEILDQEWRRAKRTRSVFSLLFVDIDRFKAYNDTYGHQAGDDALAAVARCIGENIRRPADSAARYGGEEFVVVLPDTTPEGAASLAEKIRTAISDLAIEHAGSEYGRVTASIGAAGWIPERDSDASAVIRAADEALYNAKATGRNKVALAMADTA